MNTITEGKLVFYFPEAATASKYDDWVFYRNQFNAVCGGTKAIDLLYLSQHTLWLIEVKDYREHQRTKSIDLADEVAAKVRDSLAALVAAQFNANEQEEKSLARQSLKKKELRVVLHLEQPKQHSRLFPRLIDPATVQIKLRQKVRAIDVHARVIDQYSIPHRAEIEWSVRSLKTSS